MSLRMVRRAALTAKPLGPAPVLGALLGQAFDFNSVGTAHSATVSNKAVTAGRLLVAVVAGSTTGTSHPTLSMGDTLGNTWTLAGQNDWFGSASDSNIYQKIQVYTCVVAASGTDTFTASTTTADPSGVFVAVFPVTGQNASPLGVTGTQQTLNRTSAGGETYSFTTTTTGSPTGNSLMIAVCVNGSERNAAYGAGPANMTDDATFTAQGQYNERPGSTSTPYIGIDMASNAAGKSACGWTNVPGPTNANYPVMLSGLLVEIKAA